MSFAPEDSLNVQDLYRYYDGKIASILTDSGQKLFYKGEYPQIFYQKTTVIVLVGGVIILD